MRKINFWLLHTFYIIFPILVLFGCYGLWILLTICMDVSFEEQRVCDDFNFGNSKNQVESDPFLQNEQFSVADIQDEISTYEYSLPSVSRPFGAQINLKNSDKNKDLCTNSISEQSGAKVQVLTVENSHAENKPNNLEPPPVWNLTTADVWRIETSYASHLNPSTSQMKKILFYRWVKSRWQKEDAEAFFANLIPTQPQIFYVHGNRTELNTAMMQGLKVLRNCHSELPPRLVLWTWDADRVSCRPKFEYSTKARYADFQGFYLAKILKNITPENPVLLCGHSFGTRTILSALHLLAGGAYNEQMLNTAFIPETSSTEVSWKSTVATEKNTRSEKFENSDNVRNAKINAFLVAPAIGCTALNPQALFSRALEPISRMVITQNMEDPALKYYPLLYGARHRMPEAMGVVGPTVRQIEESQREKIHVIRVDYPTHRFLEYLDMRCVQNGLTF